ncbi:MAG: hypothetical protein IT359_02440 [Gemmatimonadaceae bacterium]|nr:hypothetical protein [Gemmatimonadaceae bacterium]
MASQLDGPGQIKMQTLDEGMQQLQRLHALVERYAMAVKTQGDTGQFRQQLTRTGTPMVGLLKPQFGIIADVVTGVLLIASRGGSDQMKVRALREGVAQLRAQLEIAVTKVKEKHAIVEEPKSPGQ